MHLFTMAGRGLRGQPATGRSGLIFGLPGDAFGLSGDGEAPMMEESSHQRPPGRRGVHTHRAAPRLLVTADTVAAPHSTHRLAISV
jgi:hypothetical protein